MTERDHTPHGPSGIETQKLHNAFESVLDAIENPRERDAVMAALAHPDQVLSHNFFLTTLYPAENTRKEKDMHAIEDLHAIDVMLNFPDTTDSDVAITKRSPSEMHELLSDEKTAAVTLNNTFVLFHGDTDENPGDPVTFDNVRYATSAPVHRFMAVFPGLYARMHEYAHDKSMQRFYKDMTVDTPHAREDLVRFTVAYELLQRLVKKDDDSYENAYGTQAFKTMGKAFFPPLYRDVKKDPIHEPVTDAAAFLWK